MLSSARVQERLARRTIALVLAGGRGSRLKQLTDRRAKPAVFFGGKFRIIDFALSNLVNGGCLRICVHGPTMVVYPEGTWYNGMTADRIPQFVRQHLVEGRPVEEWVFARNPLAAPAGGPTPPP